MWEGGWEGVRWKVCVCEGEEGGCEAGLNVQAGLMMGENGSGMGWVGCWCEWG